MFARSLWPATWGLYAWTHPNVYGDRWWFRRSALRIGVQVALISAGAMGVFMAAAGAYVWWQLTPAQVREPRGPHDISLVIDPRDLALALLVVGAGGVLMLGAGSWVIASRAVKPLEEASRIQRHFVADASHELRTPLTVMDARIQQLGLRVPTDDSNRELVDALQSDSRALATLIGDMLATAAGDRELAPLSDVRRTLVTVIESVGHTARGAGVTIALSGPEVSVALPSGVLQRSLLAILDNAVSFSPRGGEVRISVERHVRWVVVRIADSGPGITGISSARVFDRFARGTPSGGGRGTSRPSHGIGLALVREQVVMYGGDVRVERTDTTGTVMRLRLPRGARRDASGA